MINLRMLKLSDSLLWFSMVGLILIGFLAVFSSTFGMQTKVGGDAFLFVKRQFVSLLVGLLGLVVFSYLDYNHLKKVSPYFYGVTIFLLTLVLFIGGRGQGAQRWLQLGSFSFQPSELSKITIIISLAAFFSQRKKVSGFFEILYLLFLVGIPFLLVFKQPDLGTALVFYVILIGMLFTSDYSSRMLIVLVTPVISLLLRPFLYLWLIYIFLLVVLLFFNRAKIWDWILILGINIGVGIALPFIWAMLKPYQRQRIVSFLSPEADPYGAGYHTLQSKIAIGSGGIFGKGFLRGTQTQLQFIPEQHSDFIFSEIGEEFGWLGSMVVLGLFAIYLWRSIIIALHARDSFGFFLAIGIATMTCFHVLANVGMALGVLPVVGIPLPFVSYGGSSLFVNLVSVGILQSISMRRQKIIF